MAKLRVEIVTPEKRLLKAEADEVIAPGATGLFGVRPGHAPFLSKMSAGPVTVSAGAQKNVFFVAGGFVEATATLVRVLADQAEPQASIDVAAAQKRIAEAEAKMKDYELTDARTLALREAIRVEQKRLEVARPK
ncbi:MAG: ATP synthase F1 subunit epsilon [Myxococcales bacterium]|nr:ATP synthase F1 subunit epsilon [Myxococcales bacterium]